MTDIPKKKRNTSPLSPTACADRIAAALGELPHRIEAGRANAEAEARAALQAYISRQLGRVPEAQRDRVAAVLLALGCELNGFEIVAANDAVRAAEAPDEPHPDWLDEQPPPVDRIEVDRSTGDVRRVGVGRK